MLNFHPYLTLGLILFFFSKLIVTKQCSSIVCNQGSLPTWKMSFKFSSQESASNQGNVGEFCHVHLPEKESGCDCCFLILTE